MDIQLSQPKSLWKKMTDFVIDRVRNNVGQNRRRTIRIYWLEKCVSQHALITITFECLCARHRALTTYHMMDMTTYQCFKSPLLAFPKPILRGLLEQLVGIFRYEFGNRIGRPNSRFRPAWILN